jgi:hypothetical protein
VAPLLLTCLIAGLFPWRAIVDQARTLARLRPQVLAFLAAAEDQSDGEPIYSEEIHLFKTEYRKEVVDAGDTSAIVARSKYFGEAFLQTFENYVARLAYEPPRFVVAGFLDEASFLLTTSPELANLLKGNYAITLRSPDVFLANGGGYLALFERRPP